MPDRNRGGLIVRRIAALIEERVGRLREKPIVLRYWAIIFCQPPVFFSTE